MATKEQIALNNDLKKLSKHFNPKYVSIYKIPTNDDSICSLKFVMKVPTYVSTRTCSAPVSKQFIEFFMDIYPNYPKSKPKVYYGGTEWLHHINVFSDEIHTQCTDSYDPENSSIIELAEKTARAIVFDTNVRRFDSMATSTYADWQRNMEKIRRLPTMEPGLLFSRNIRRTPRAM